MDAKLANDTSQITPESYRQLIERVDRLERMLLKLMKIAEDRDDIQAMREAEIEYRSGDAIAFEDLVAEILAEEA